MTHWHWSTPVTCYSCSYVTYMNATVLDRPTTCLWRKNTIHFKTSFGNVDFIKHYKIIPHAFLSGTWHKLTRCGRGIRPAGRRGRRRSRRCATWRRTAARGWGGRRCSRAWGSRQTLTSQISSARCSPPDRWSENETGTRHRKQRHLKIHVKLLCPCMTSACVNCCFERRVTKREREIWAIGRTDGTTPVYMTSSGGGKVTHRFHVVEVSVVVEIIDCVLERVASLDVQDTGDRRSRVIMTVRSHSSLTEIVQGSTGTTCCRCVQCAYLLPVCAIMCLLAAGVYTNVLTCCWCVQ